MTTNPSNLTSLGLRPGDKVDKFEIVGQIGQGGMSIVWKGVDKLLDRYVAIKQINLDLSTGGNEEAFRERFRHEAAIQKKIAAQHKNLVKIIEVIEEPRGLFIVMEYIEGQSLEQLVAHTKGPLDQTLALGIVGATALALDAIHKANVIHRDLKPSNILLPKEGGLKVCDFGLATLIGDQDALDSGTVRYMAPEAFGDDPIDGRADIYSLGFVAYEMLAGREKFNDAFKVVLRDQRNQALRWMKWHTNPRVTAPPLHQLNPAVPQKLSDLVARMMEKDRDLRVGSSAELVEAIRRHFSGGGQHEPRAKAAPRGAAAVADTAEPTAQLPRKSRLPYILAALALFWVLVGVGVWQYFEMQKSGAVAAQRAAAVDVYVRAKALFEEQNDYAAALPMFQELALAWPNDKNLHDWSLAHVKFIQAEEATKAQDYAAAHALYEEVEGLLRSTGNLKKLDLTTVDAKKRDAHNRQTLGALFATVQDAINSNDFDEARRRLTALRNSSEAMLPQDKQRIEDLGNQIEAKERDGKILQILTAAEGLAGGGERGKAIEYLRAAYAQYPDQRLDALLNKLNSDEAYDRAINGYNAALASGNLAQAEVELLRAMKLRPGEAKLQDQHKQIQTRAALERAKQAEARGDLEAAINEYRKALPDAQATAALERLKVAEDRAGMERAGDAAVAAGDFALAIKQYQQRLRMGDDAGVAAKLKDAQINLDLNNARAAIADSDAPKARQHLDAVFKLDPNNQTGQELLTQVNEIDSYKRHLASGDNYRRQGKFGDAIKQYSDARKVRDTPEVRQRLTDTEYESWLSRGKQQLAVGDYATAKASLKAAQGVHDTPEVRQLLVEVLAKLGEKEGT